MSFVLETVFPSLGVLLSNALYAAPLPAVLKAARHGQLGGFNPMPLALMLTNTIGFLAYGLEKPDHYVIASNFGGVFISIWYLAKVLPLMRDEPQLGQLQHLLVGCGVFLALELSWVRVALEAPQRAGAIGGFSTCVCICMFAAPLSTLSEVVRTRSSASLYAPLTLAQVGNCTLWSVYGVAIGDVWVSVPNVIGLLLGLIQATLIALFPARARASADEKESIMEDVSTHSTAEVGSGARRWRELPRYQSVTRVRPPNEALPSAACGCTCQ
jgi:solute carrier family 50 protein (sugar transporter)